MSVNILISSRTFRESNINEDNLISYFLMNKTIFICILNMCNVLTICDTWSISRTKGRSGAVAFALTIYAKVVGLIPTWRNEPFLRTG